MRRTVVSSFLFGFVSLVGCRDQASTAPAPTPTAAGTITVDGKIVEVVRTSAALRRIEGVQKAFRATRDPKRPGPTHAVILPGEVDHFVGTGERSVVAVAPGKSTGATVELPLESDGALRVQSEGITVAAKPIGMARKSAEFAQKIAIYADAAQDTTLYRRVDHAGAEDFFHVSTARDRLTHSYDVALTGVAGLRLVANTLELLDASGTPRLATTAPTVIDAKGVKRQGTISVRGCAYDKDASEPWGRAVTAPGNDHCVVTYDIDARGLAFPVLVDPAWFATGSHYQTHAFHQLLKLPTGKVLVLGGEGSAPAQTELYDPATKTWAASTAVPEGLGEGTNAVVLSDGTVVIAGGYPSGSDTSGTIAAKGTTYVRKPSDASWSLGPAMSSRAYHAMGVLTIGGKEVVFAAGGYPSSSGSVAARKTAEYFDPIAKTPWTTAAAMSSERAKAAYTVLTDGRFLMAGGETYSSSSFGDLDQSSTEIFDPATAKWVASGSLAKARSAAVAIAVAGGKAVVAGGWNEDDYNPLDTIEYFGGGTTWTTLTAKLTEPRQYHVGAALSDGRILFAGGNTDASKFSPIGSKTSELLTLGATPATTAKVVGAGAMTDTRMHAAAVSLGTSILVTGGWDADTTGSESKTSDLFDGSIGAACTTAATCPSGLFCTDGVCCKSMACGTGETCAAPGFEGVCTKPKGATCTTSTECGTGFCVGGICCESACSSECMSCSEAGKLGTCVQAKVGTDPKGDCMGDPICGPTCDSTGYCYEYPPDGTACGASAGDAGTGSFCTAYACNSGSCDTTTNNCGLTCTTKVSCDEASKTCTPDPSGIKSGQCVIDNKCYAYGDLNPTNPCQLCDPPSSKIAWSDSPSCSDGGVVDSGMDDTGSDDTGTAEDTGSVEDSGTVTDTGSAADSSTVVDTGEKTAAGDLPEGQACSCDVPGKSSSSPLAALGVALGLAVVATRRRR